jgi:apolipoprotein N-acyltransferase
MVNVTYEGWYHVPGELKQHVAMAVFRAVETRTTMVRAANTGISCFIDPLGEIYAALEPNTAGALAAPVKTCPDSTVYVGHGDGYVLAFLVLMFALPPLAVVWFGRNR